MNAFFNAAPAAPPLHQESDSEIGGRDWRQLVYLGGYRVCLAAVFVIPALSDRLPPPFGEHNPRLFLLVSALYAAGAIAALFAIRWRRPAFGVQVYALVLLDIAAITLLMHASGGVRSGLGMLLIIAIAGGSLLMEGRTARLFAAIATLAVLAEQFVAGLDHLPHGVAYTQAGLLGAAFFATAILAHVLAERLRESEALAERRGVDLANMAHLTEYVIQRMQTGILVVDSQYQIRLINESAARLLEAPAAAHGQAVDRVCSALADQLREWWSEPGAEPRIFRAAPTASEVLPRFARLGADRVSGTLVFLEDTAGMAQQAQQLKLASLGRLTASIAHEVRNPLGAISHAGQLLAESPNLSAGDLRLTEIIQEHSQRVNVIVENIMQLSRRDRARPEDVALKPWLELFIDEFCLSERIERRCIRLQISPPDTRVRIDPSQLHQVLWNLCHNGIRHSGTGGEARLLLTGGFAPDSPNPYLDVIDNGPGIAIEAVPQIFEPFFTTAKEGTGMGLYIARELCEGNQARLNYIESARGGARFRITFADPRRRQVA